MIKLTRTGMFLWAIGLGVFAVALPAASVEHSPSFYLAKLTLVQEMIAHQWTMREASQQRIDGLAARVMRWWTICKLS